jgi:multidrug efflux pump subunit AcrA (membrane-fusion protein)
METIMKKQKYIIIAAGVAIILFAYFSMSFLSGFKKEPVKAPEKEIFRYVKAEAVNYSNQKGEIFASGRVYSKSEVALSAEVGGKILSGNVPFKKGQKFRKGDLLLKIYDKEAGLSLKANKSTFLNGLAGILPDYKIDYSDNYENWYNFFERIDIEKDLPELPEIKTTKEKVFLASRNILSSYYNIKSAESTFKKHSIYAPFSGAISTVNVEVGGFAGIGSRLGNIINTRDLEVEVPLKIEDANWVKRGDKVTLKSDLSTEAWTGLIGRKSGDLDVQTQSVSVFVDVTNNRNASLYKGQYLKAYFNSLTISDVMKIPRNAIVNNDQVFVVVDGLLKKESVNVVKVSEKSAYINGLVENTMVVVQPLVNANENTKVKILENN